MATTIKKIALALGFVGSVFFSTQASAACCGSACLAQAQTNGTNIAKEGLETRTLIKEEHDSTRKTFAKALKIARNAISEAIMFNAESTREALKVLGNAQSARDLAPPPNSCVTEHAAAAMATPTAVVRVEQRANQNYFDSRIQAYRDFGGAYSQLVGLSASTSSSNKSHLFKGDTLISADSLMNGQTTGNRDANGRLLLKSASAYKTFSKDQIFQAQSYIEMLSLGALPGIPPSDSTNYQEALIKQKIAQARLSLASSAYSFSLAQKAPSGYAQKMIGMLKSVGAEATLAEGMLVGGDMSYDAALASEVDRRFLNRLWHSQIAGNTTGGAIKELAYMKALALRMQLDSNATLMRIEQQIALTNILLMDQAKSLNPEDAAEDEAPKDAMGNTIVNTRPSGN